jgi:hypothetical protein
MFDPYRKWMGIPKGPRPPTHYLLLGIAPDEADAEIIKEAALRQTAQVRVFQTGPHADLCTRLLNEIAQARAVLLNPRLRGEYDERLAAPPPAQAPAVGPIDMPALSADAPTFALVVRQPPGVRRRGPHFDIGSLLAALGYVVLLLLGGAASFWVTYDGLDRAAQQAAKGQAPAATPPLPGDKAR